MNAASATATGGSWDHERAPMAFDGNPGFGMVSGTQSLPGTTKWVANATNPVIGATTADGLPRRVSAYTIVSGNDATGRYPRNWTLQGSNDGVAWSVLDTVADEASAYSYNTPRTYVVDAPGDFARYRLAITANNGAGTLYQIGDLLLYETVVPEPTALAAVGAGLFALARPRRRPCCGKSAPPAHGSRPPCHPERSEGPHRPHPPSPGLGDIGKRGPSLRSG
jgi:hypothetical protein